jgi:hypothetical protein
MEGIPETTTVQPSNVLDQLGPPAPEAPKRKSQKKVHKKATTEDQSSSGEVINLLIEVLQKLESDSVREISRNSLVAQALVRQLGEMYGMTSKKDARNDNFKQLEVINRANQLGLGSNTVVTQTVQNTSAPGMVDKKPKEKKEKSSSKDKPKQEPPQKRVHLICGWDQVIKSDVGKPHSEEIIGALLPYAQEAQRIREELKNAGGSSGTNLLMKSTKFVYDEQSNQMESHENANVRWLAEEGETKNDVIVLSRQPAAAILAAFNPGMYAEFTSASMKLIKDHPEFDVRSEEDGKQGKSRFKIQTSETVQALQSANVVNVAKKGGSTYGVSPEGLKVSKLSKGVGPWSN